MLEFAENILSRSKWEEIQKTRDPLALNEALNTELDKLTGSSSLDPKFVDHTLSNCL